MNKKTVLMILIDGFRHDYVNPEDSPFLYSLSGLNISAKVRETFAFELRPAFFAGLQPEECGVANMFCYDPEGSPFRALDVRHGDRQRITRDLRAEAAKRGYSLVRHIGGSAEIPLHLLKYFNFSEKINTPDPGSLGGHKTLFDYLRSNGEKWLWIGYPEDDGTTKGVLDKLNGSDVADKDFIYLHFSALDWAGHEHGPHSPGQRKVLAEIDEAIRQVYSRLNKTFADIKGVIFGDHGQVEVKKHIDMEKRLNETGLTLEKDYIYFLDSTQARFWFFNETARDKITDLMQGVEDGRILTASDIERLRFRFEDNRFGDLVFVVNDGVGIFPNFFQHEKPCKGLHGYLPEVEGNWARLIITGCGMDDKPEKVFELVHLFPTLLDMLGYERSSSAGAASIFDKVGRGMKEDAFRATVVLPTYNRLETFKKCLKRIEAQTIHAGDYELVVVDDGSKDGTKDFLEEYKKSTKLNFRYFTQENTGPAGARNLAIRNALGRIIILIGDDMLMEQDFIENHLKFHDKRAELASIGLGLIVWSKEIETTELMKYITSPEGGQQFNYWSFKERDCSDVGWMHFWSSNISFKRAFALTHGLFNAEVFRHAMWEDTELGYRLSRAGGTIHFRKNCLVYHEHKIDLEGFVKRQQMVGWYSHDMVRLGLNCAFSGKKHEREMLFSQRALKEIVEAVKEFEKGCSGSDIEMLRRLYGTVLYYASRVGYEDRANNTKEKIGAIVALTHNLAVLSGTKVTDEDIERQVMEKDRQIHELRNSWSWKITAPLRGVIKALKG